MKNHNILVIGLLILSGCQWITPSSSSLSFSSSIPIPNDDFSPLIDGRKFLIEDTKTFTYGFNSVGDLTELLLSKINYPTNQTYRTSYAVTGATLGQFNNQPITFEGNLQPDARDTLASMAIGGIVSESATIALLDQLSPSDERFNQKSIIKKERNLSQAFFESEYYWFNHYVLEETLTIQRYQNQILYGTANQTKTFQTAVSIPVGVQYQLYADASMIYEIRDETYPSNYFGARDTKFETIRTQDNLKKALTLGPATEMLGTWRLLSEGHIPFGVDLQEPLATYQRSIVVTKTANDTLVFSLRIYQGESWLASSETFEFQAALKGQIWQDVQQTYRLWEPSIS